MKVLRNVIASKKHETFTDRRKFAVPAFKMKTGSVVKLGGKKQNFKKQNLEKLLT